LGVINTNLTRQLDEEIKYWEIVLKHVIFTVKALASRGLSFRGHVEKFGSKIENCRGQSYDNDRNMLGIYSGLQARIKELNPIIEYMPCSGHSLNLV